MSQRAFLSLVKEALPTWRKLHFVGLDFFAEKGPGIGVRTIEPVLSILKRRTKGVDEMKGEGRLSSSPLLQCCTGQPDSGSQRSRRKGHVG